MTLPTTEAPPAPGPSVPARTASTRRAVAWLLLFGWLATLGVAVVTGAHGATVDDLQDAIADGDVDKVQASEGLHGGTGFATVELRWREHGIPYATEVLQVRGRPPRHAGGGDVTGRFTGSLENYLTQYGGTVEIERHAGSPGGIHARYVDWRIDEWAVTLLLGMLVVTVLHIGLQPETWRATRWAGLWLVIALPPVAGPAYLLLGGPTGLFRPADPRRRLTGGWAFVLGLLISNVGSNA
jgi:hypothetical protein